MAECPICGTELPDSSKFCLECGYSFTGSQTGQLNADTILEDRYVILKTLGRGGMGAVYMALDTRLNNMPVAIKEMSTNAVGTGNLQAAIGAFKKEASMLISLRHPALPRINDFFAKGEDRWYLVMDYIEGETLKQLVDRRGPIPEAEVLDWARQIGDILTYLHEQNPPIIFRDLKPANIMLTPQGQIKLIDLGIARHFRQGVTADTSTYGSSGFAPIEQYGENQTDARADIYALGATLHYLLTGIDPIKNPFQFEAPSKIAKVSPRLETAIMKALELKAEDRPGSVVEMINMLPDGTVRPNSPNSTDPSKPDPTKSVSKIKEQDGFTTTEAPQPKLLDHISESSILASATTKLDIQAEENELVLSEVSEDNTMPIKSGDIQFAQTKTNLEPEEETTGRQSNAKSTVDSLRQNKIPGKVSNIFIVACLVLAIIFVGVYGINYYHSKTTASSVTGDDLGPTTQTNSSSPNHVQNNESGGNNLSNTNTENPNVQKNTLDKKSSSKKIIFNDAAIEKAIRDAINKPQGEVYVDDVRNITKLDLNGKRISNIEDLKELTNLQSLDLINNQICNIEALRSLTNLAYLNLNGNQISNIEALQGMTNLTYLGLGDNQISNIEALRGLINLTNLSLDDNQISSIEALRSLSNLVHLGLNGNQISNIEALRGLTNLTGLWLGGNPISDYSPVKPYYDNLEGKDFNLRYKVTF